MQRTAQATERLMRWSPGFALPAGHVRPECPNLLAPRGSAVV